MCVLSCVRLFVIPWTGDQLGYSVHGIFLVRILEWLPFPIPGYLPNPGVETASPVLAGRFTAAEPGKEP